MSMTPAKRPRRPRLDDGSAAAASLLCVKLTEDERNNKRLSSDNLRRAEEALRSVGAVIIEDAIDADYLDRLKQRMEEDLQDTNQLSFNYNDGHLQQNPPPEVDYIFPSVVANPFVEQLVQKVLGETVALGVYSGNTNQSGSKPQPVHSDVGHEVKERDETLLVVNVPLVGVTERNGSIELWPGTHVLNGVAFTPSQKAWPKIAESQLDIRRRVAPPLRANTTRGSLLVRDRRLWHRGMPNLSESPRIMLSMVYAARGAVPKQGPLRFATGCREKAFTESSLSLTRIAFTDEPLRYLAPGFSQNVA